MALMEKLVEVFFAGFVPSPVALNFALLPSLS